MKLFVYESLSAGELGRDAPASLRREGWAMLAALAGDFSRVADVSTILAFDEPDIPGVRCVRANVADEPHYFGAIADECDAVALIAPEFDGILLRRAEMILTTGRRLLSCAPAGIRATSHKGDLAKEWMRRGVPTLPTNWPSYPKVVKAADGAGSLTVRLVASEAEWREGYHDQAMELPGRRDYVSQPFHRGLACSVAFLIGPHGRIPLPPTQQSLSDDGRFKYLGGRLPLDPDLARRATAIATAAIDGIPGLMGYVGVDLILGEHGDDVAIEINPRPTTSYLGLRALCRDNLAEAWLRLAEGADDVPLAWRAESIAFQADGTIDGERGA